MPLLFARFATIVCALVVFVPAVLSQKIHNGPIQCPKGMLHSAAPSRIHRT